MKLTILCVFLISVCRAQQQNNDAVQRPVRAPQGQVQYVDPDGLVVNWKLYTPNTQRNSQLETPKRDARAESETAQPRSSQHDYIKPAASKRAVHQLQPEQEVQYKPFSMVPGHIKQLLQHMYEPQQPYVDPSVYVYNQGRQRQQQDEDAEEEQEKPQQEEEESAQASAQAQYSTGLYEHIPKYQTKYPVGKSKLGYIKYKDEQSSSESENPRYGSIPGRQEESVEDQRPQQQQQPQYSDGMPTALHQLLNLQAQTPYHVIANGIVYKPKSIFVPKPFTEDTKGPYKYRSKVYYYKNDGYEPESKERPEREEPREQEEEE